ncbi:MAG: LysR family transcriptional regulator [Myxococcales bacterium]|nr:LysR family transcriptional regulator [Myxococcales bacterium]
MELRELGYFVAVFEEGSVSAAARRSHISQPSVSAALAALEAELGTTLFLRHRRGVAPTAAADQLYPTARRLIAEAEALRAAFRAPPAPRAPVEVGVLRALDAARGRELLRALAASPELQLRLVEPEARCDVRVISRGMLRAGETFRPLWSERFVVALPAAHPLALRPTLRAADLLGQPFIERCHCEHARQFARRQPRVEPVAVAASEEWALALVAAGVGVAIVPAGSVRADPQIAVRPLADVAVTREIGLALRARLPQPIVRLCAAVQARFATAARAA